jgi:hypothetical protein
MTTHSLIWLFTIIVVFLFAPLVISQKDYEECIRKELTEASDWYGAEEVQVILDRTNKIYDATMVSSGLDPSIRKYFVKPTPSKELAPGVTLPAAMSPYADRLMEYWGNLLHNIWLFCFRLSHSFSWLFYLAPFLVAVFFDGLMTRKAKLASFRYTSPTLYNLSWHLIIAMAAVSLVAFSVITPINIFVYPIVLTGMGVLVRVVLSNIQHSA